jgi:hypothetical protein
MLAELATLATPETILRWYRRMIAAKYDGSQTLRSPGRPPTANHVTKQLLTMARESPSWGYTRLRGALRDLGFDVARSTIQYILRDNGIEPAPRRGKTPCCPKTGPGMNLGAFATAAPAGAETTGDYRRPP